MNEHFFIYNDKFFRSHEPVISAGNRSLMYGDGLFETMRMRSQTVINADFHFERFLSGLKTLQFQIPNHFSPDYFLKKLKDLSLRNNNTENAKIRLMVFRGDGSIFNTGSNVPNYILETFSLPEEINLNETGLVVDVFPDGKKTCDQFSNLKSNNYLLNVMAGLFAQKYLLDDCLLLNSFGRICESAIANIFIIKGQNIYTPPLSEGCVAGVMRRCFLEKIPLIKYNLIEKEISITDIIEAEEFFLTNSLHPLRWVKSFQGKIFGNEKVKDIFQIVSGNL